MQRDRYPLLLLYPSIRCQVQANDTVNHLPHRPRPLQQGRQQAQMQGLSRAERPSPNITQQNRVGLCRQLSCRPRGEDLGLTVVQDGGIRFCVRSRQRVRIGLRRWRTRRSWSRIMRRVMRMCASKKGVGASFLKRGCWSW